MAYRQSLVKYAEKYGLEVQQEPVVQLFLEGSLGLDDEVSDLPVQTAPQPSPPTQRSGAEADSGSAPPQPELGYVGAWHQLRKQDHTRCPESLFCSMRKLWLFLVAEKSLQA